MAVVPLVAIVAVQMLENLPFNRITGGRRAIEEKPVLPGTDCMERQTG